jgi:N utilization substance protein B
VTGEPIGPERHRSREAALQLLYQWEVGWAGSNGPEEATRAFWECHPAPRTRRGFAAALVEGTTTHLDTIDSLLESNARNWRLARMAVVDRLIMRMAIYELVYTDTPTAVVIDEALELAKTFSGGEAVAFINGVLDGVQHVVRERHGDEESGA